jgi:hypothetical protein
MSFCAQEIDKGRNGIPILVYRGIPALGDVSHKLKEIRNRKLLKLQEPLFIGLARRRNLLPRLLRGRLKFQLSVSAFTLVFL